MRKLTVITIINLILLMTTVVFRLASKEIDTNSIRVFLVEFYVKEIVFLYLVTVTGIVLFTRKNKIVKVIELVGSLITLVLLIWLFKGLTPW